ncbi:MAG: MFS transporter [Chloroflexi bacterium]|nr:MFS transporter [Chloroflexota bacterium]
MAKPLVNQPRVPTPNPPAVSRRIFYGWWVVVGGMASSTVTGIFRQYGTGAFFRRLVEDLGTTRTALSGALSLSQLETGLLGPLEGVLIDNLGPRLVMAIGSVIFGVGFMALAFVHSVPAFYVVFLVMALGSSLASYLPMVACLNNWFVRKRALALGIAMTGSSIGGILVPGLAWSIISFGWRHTAFGAGLIVIAAGLPIALLMRRRPEDYGLLPDGATTPGVESSPKEARGSGAREVTGLTAAQAVRTPAFWLINASQSLALMITGAVSVHQIAAFEDMGLSLQMAATVVSVSTTVGIVGRLGGGVLGDRWDKRLALACVYAMESVGIFILANVRTLGMALLYAVTFGLADGARGPLVVALRGDYFGRRSFATIMGLGGLIITAGTAWGPVLAGYMYDLRRSYTLAFVAMASVNLLGPVMIMLAKKPSVRSHSLSGEAR